MSNESDIESQYSAEYIAQRTRVYEKDKLFYDLIQQGCISVDIQEGKAYHRGGYPLRIEKSPHGYHRCRYSRSLYITLSRLVLIAAGGVPESKFLEASHEDGNKANNSISNLRWVTRSENIYAAIQQNAKPRVVPSHALSADERNQIRKLRKEGWGLGQLARQFNTSILTVKKVLNGWEPRKARRVITYRVQSPTGELFTGTNLKEFCALKGLSYTSMKHARLRGRTYQGWSHIPQVEPVELKVAA